MERDRLRLDRVVRRSHIRCRSGGRGRLRFSRHTNSADIVDNPAIPPEVNACTVAYGNAPVKRQNSGRIVDCRDPNHLSPEAQTVTVYRQVCTPHASNAIVPPEQVGEYPNTELISCRLAKHSTQGHRGSQGGTPAGRREVVAGIVRMRIHRRIEEQRIAVETRRLLCSSDRRSNIVLPMREPQIRRVDCSTGIRRSRVEPRTAWHGIRAVKVQIAVQPCDRRS